MIKLKIYKYFLMFLITGICLTQVKSQDFNVLNFGAKNDTNQLSTIAINNAVTACYNAGGGRVVLPSGNFKSGTIILKDNVELFLNRGAVLYASTDHKDFPRQKQPLYRSQKDAGGWYALIYANDAKNIGITGFGTINGQGANQLPALVSTPNNPVIADQDGRPRNILFISCKKISIRDVSMMNAGIWNQHYLDCEDVIINNIQVYNHGNRNNDAIDLDGCRRVVLSNSILDSDDDCVTLKSTGKAPCEDITVNNCVLSSFCNAIKCGTESTGGFKNIVVSNCVVKPSKCLAKPMFKTPRIGQTAVALEIVDGGTMDGVSIKNIIIEGTTCPIFIRLGNRARKYIGTAPTPPMGQMRNISISNITAYNTGNNCSSITGVPRGIIENITLDNIRITNKGGLKSGDFLRDLTKVGELEKEYPAPLIWGNLPSAGFFIRHVKDISMSNITLRSTENEIRVPILADDITDFYISNLKATGATDKQVQLNNVTTFKRL